MFTGHENVPDQVSASADGLKLVEDFGLLYLNEKLSDVTFLVAGKKLYAHKAILSVRNKCFEIEIFRRVVKWCEKNKNNIVLDCVRLSTLTISQIVAIVWPTKLVNSEKLLQTMSEIIGTSSKDLRPRAMLAIDENVGTVDHVAKVITEVNTDVLLSGDTNVDKNFQHMIDGENGIVIYLRRPYCLNHICMMLYDTDDRYYSYYIERSVDKKKWHKIVDYTRYACRSVQNLYFEPQVAQYIKIVGTSNSKGNDFHVVFFEAFYKTQNIPKTINAVTCPVKNVATPEYKATVLEGSNPLHLLNGKYTEYAYHKPAGNPDSLIVQLAQPYVISSMQLLLHSTYKYKYFIETSIDKTNWDIIVDRRNEECQSWQNLNFVERVAVFIKITGTYSNASDRNFYCNHFECPSEGEK